MKLSGSACSASQPQSATHPQVCAIGVQLIASFRSPMFAQARLHVPGRGICFVEGVCGQLNGCSLVGVPAFGLRGGGVVAVA